MLRELLNKTREFAVSLIDYNKKKVKQKSEKIEIDSIPIPVTIWDANLSMIGCNQEVLRELGLSGKKGYVDNFFKYAPLHQSDGILSAEKAVALMKESFLKGKLEFEWMAKDIDGNRIHFINSCTVGNYRGKPALFMYSSVIERKSPECFFAVADYAPLVIQCWDQNFKCIYCNTRTLDFYGLASKQEYLDKVYLLMPDTQPNGEPSQKYWENVLKETFDKGFSSYDFTAEKLDGTTVPLETTFKRMCHNNETIVISYSQDVSERLYATIAEEKNKTKSRFLARMSHDVRTPIMAVLGIAEIQLRSLNLPHPVEVAFTKISISANMLLELVNDLLDLSAIEANKMEIANSKYETVDLISAVSMIYSAYLGNKEISFNLDVDESLPVFLIGDSLRIKQILNNLVSNAFKYTEQGTVKVILRNKEHPDEGWINFAIVIQDTGFGMTNEQLKTLFDEYERFHTSEKNNVTGIGLGMPIVYSIVKLMNADIDVQSEVGVGTMVTVTIPQKMYDQEILGSKVTESLKQFNKKVNSTITNFSVEPLSHASVLVVDDVDINLHVIKGFLEFYRLNIETCRSGFEALGKVKAGKTYDVMFMDHIMPGLDGMETVKILRDMGYTRPVIALTANVLAEQVKNFTEIGFDDVIAKPIQSSRLDIVLNRFIRDKEYKEDLKSPEYAPEFLYEIKLEFASSQRNIFSDITQAVGLKDTVTAHRLAHTLKGLAGFIKEDVLAKIAKEMEQIFKEGEIPGTDKMNALERELALVIGKIDALQKNNPISTSPLVVKALDKEAEGILFDKLQELLSSHNAECLNMLEDLRGIAETDVLINMIQNFNFSEALDELKRLRYSELT